VDHLQAFREYATRISFNLTMSRNQVASFGAIVLDFEQHTTRLPYDETKCNITALAQVRREQGLTDRFICAARWLQANGFIREHPAIAKMRLEHEAKPDAHKWDWSLFEKHPQYILTEAGEHMAALLRLARLIPQRAANTPRRKKKAA
jgi:hypothetical protein